MQNGLKNLSIINQNEIKEIEPFVSGLGAILVPETGIIDYRQVADKLAFLIKEINPHSSILTNTKVVDYKNESTGSVVITQKDKFKCKNIIFCCGLFSDRLAKNDGLDLDMKIVGFRGDYFSLKDSAKHKVKNLIYPVPNPEFPFLGVHFTRMIKGGIEAGPNAVLAYSREGYKKSNIRPGEFFESLTYKGFRKVASKYWKTGFGEFYRSYSKSAFTKALQELLPDISKSDLIPGGSGVRAQACTKDGGLIDDFLILESERVINVGNAPSPAATSSLAIGKHVAGLALKRFT